MNNFPNTISEFKKSKEYILESLLTKYDYIESNVVPCGIFQGRDLVYYRKDVERLRSKSTWSNKLCRDIIKDAKPARVISKSGVSRPVELFQYKQTELWKNLVASDDIPVNEFGNVEFARIPTNAGFIACSDIALAIRICKGLSIPWCRCQDGWVRKSPRYVGVVVLESDKDGVETLIAHAISEAAKSEQESRDNAALSVWRVLIRRILAEQYIQKNID